MDSNFPYGLLRCPIQEGTVTLGSVTNRRSLQRRCPTTLHPASGNKRSDSTSKLSQQDNSACQGWATGADQKPAGTEPCNEEVMKCELVVDKEMQDGTIDEHDVTCDKDVI